MSFVRRIRDAAIVCVLGTPLLLAPGCTPSGNDAVVQQTPAQAQALIQDRQGDADFAILDVRNPEEFEAGHIEGAVNVCFLCDTFEDNVAELDPSKTYLIYCASDNRSGQAAAIMSEQGFADLYELTGGVNRWKAEGFLVAP